MGIPELIIALIVFVLPIALVVLAVRFFVRRSRSRPCPRCGNRVRNGVMECQSCGYDFRTVG